MYANLECIHKQAKLLIAKDRIGGDNAYTFGRKEMLYKSHGLTYSKRYLLQKMNFLDIYFFDIYCINKQELVICVPERRQ